LAFAVTFAGFARRLIPSPCLPRAAIDDRLGEGARVGKCAADDLTRTRPRPMVNCRGSVQPRRPQQIQFVCRRPDGYPSAASAFHAICVGEVRHAMSPVPIHFGTPNGKSRGGGLQIRLLECISDVWRQIRRCL